MRTAQIGPDLRLVCLGYSGSVSRACLGTCKSAKKWYLMRMCMHTVQIGTITFLGRVTAES